MQVCQHSPPHSDKMKRTVSKLLARMKFVNCNIFLFICSLHLLHGQNFLIFFHWEVVDVSICSSLKSLEQFLLNFLLKKSCYFSFCFLTRLSLCLLSWHSHNFWPVGQHPQHISTHDVNASWVPKLKWPLRTYLTFNTSLCIHIRYCVLFVSLCLFLCTKNFGQYACNKFMHRESFPLKQFAFQDIASKTSIEIKHLLVQVLR
jgi:hypothetical protein